MRSKPRRSYSALATPAAAGSTDQGTVLAWAISDVDGGMVAMDTVNAGLSQSSNLDSRRRTVHARSAQSDMVFGRQSQRAPAVTRNCSVPADKMLFFPVINNVSFSAPVDVCGSTGPETARQLRADAGPLSTPRTIWRSISTVTPLKKSQFRRVQSDVFAFAFPADNSTGRGAFLSASDIVASRRRRILRSVGAAETRCPYDPHPSPIGLQRTTVRYRRLV